MIIKKRLNNNVALAVDHDKQVVVMGSGISFQKQPGDTIDEKKIDQIYYPGKTFDDELENYQAMLASLDPKILAVTQSITQLAAQRLHQKFDFPGVISLADHLQFAIQRLREGTPMTSPLSWEIRQFYPQEVAISQESLVLVKRQLGVQLPSEEVTMLALHFVTMQGDMASIDEVMHLTELTKAVLKLVKYQLQQDFDPNDLAYVRFVTHIRYYLLRQMRQEPITETIDPVLMATVKQRYPQCYQVAQAITDYLNQQQHWQTSNEELMFLTLHIQRLSQRADDKQLNN